MQATAAYPYELIVWFFWDHSRSQVDDPFRAPTGSFCLALLWFTLLPFGWILKVVQRYFKLVAVSFEVSAFGSIAFKLETVNALCAVFAIVFTTRRASDDWMVHFDVAATVRA